MSRPRTGLPFLDAGLEEGAVLALAHRGGAGHPDLVGLENTVTAFEHAVGLGYAYLETDVQATRDEVLVAFHDDVLDRVTGSPGRLRERSAAELRSALVGGREPIPAMADLLEALPGARFNIDLKSEVAVRLLAELVERTGTHDRVCVGAFSERRLRRFRRLVTRPVATSYGPVGVGLGRFGPDPVAARVLAGTTSGGHVLQVPHRRGPVPIVTAAFVARAHAASRPVHVWTVDDPEEMEVLLDLGVDGLVTDRTDLLRTVLERRGQWLGSPP